MLLKALPFRNDESVWSERPVGNTRDPSFENSQHSGSISATTTDAWDQSLLERDGSDPWAIMVQWAKSVPKQVMVSLERQDRQRLAFTEMSRLTIVLQN